MPQPYSQEIKFRSYKFHNKFLLALSKLLSDHFVFPLTCKEKVA